MSEAAKGPVPSQPPMIMILADPSVISSARVAEWPLRPGGGVPDTVKRSSSRQSDELDEEDAGEILHCDVKSAGVSLFSPPPS